PSGQTVRFLDRLLREQVPEPAYVETVTLHRLADLAGHTAPADWPGEGVYWLLQAVALGGQAVSRPGGFPLPRGLLEEAAQTRYEGEYLFWARGYAPPPEAARLLRLSAGRCQTLLAYQDDFERAQRCLTDALAFLPAFVPYVDAFPTNEDTW